ncbi:MAG: hypothetical protein K2O41_00540 [Clostridia bacterium]|nr:hypothetical protein [Clostridia bacterium]
MFDLMRILRSQFQCDLTFIENSANYYAMFRYVIESCARAEFANSVLHNSVIFSDENYIENLNRIQKAKERATVTHGEWAINAFEQSETQHTPRTFVSSVYSDIFNIVLKPKDGNQ